MKSSSKFVVATHILAGLAVVYEKKTAEVVSSENIAWSVNTNPVVIRRILGELKKAGLVVTLAGSQGGAKISRDPKDIYLSEIYDAVENGGIFQLHYKSPNPDCPIGSNIQNVMEEPLTKAENALREQLSQISLSQIAQKLLEKMN